MLDIVQISTIVPLIFIYFTHKKEIRIERLRREERGNRKFQKLKHIIIGWEMRPTKRTEDKKIK